MVHSGGLVKGGKAWSRAAPGVADWMASITNHAAHVRADWVAPPTQACKRWPAVTTGTRRSGSPSLPVSHPRRRHCGLVLGLLRQLLLISQVRESRISLDSWRNSKCHLQCGPPGRPLDRHLGTPSHLVLLFELAAVEDVRSLCGDEERCSVGGLHAHRRGY